MFKNCRHYPCAAPDAATCWAIQLLYGGSHVKSAGLLALVTAVVVLQEKPLASRPSSSGGDGGALLLLFAVGGDGMSRGAPTLPVAHALKVALAPAGMGARGAAP